MLKVRIDLPDHLGIPIVATLPTHVHRAREGVITSGEPASEVAETCVPCISLDPSN